MNQAAVSFWEEIKPKFYIFCSGLVLGLLLGWFMHGIIGTILKIFVILLIVVPLIAAIYFWRNVSNERSKSPRSDITDASWREVDDRP
jgi:F0F1-type ATP synthase assembly protein I